MSIEKVFIALIVSFPLAAPAFGAETTSAAITIRPGEVSLAAPEESSQLLVTQTIEERRVDLTRQAKYQVDDPTIARVDADGRVHPIADGSTRVIVLAGGAELQLPVTVAGMNKPPRVSFA